MSELRIRKIVGKDGGPVEFPTGILIGGGNGGGLVNNIGTPNAPGFGVGICPGPLPAGIYELPGTRDVLSDEYGNYTTSDGSAIIWVPAHYRKIGTGSNGLPLNKVDPKPFSYFPSVAAANAAGYSLPRSFYNGGRIQPGYFRDKYPCTNNNGIASSIKNRPAVTSAVRGSLASQVFSALNGAPANNYGGAIAAAKTRGSGWFCATRAMKVDSAFIALARAQAVSSNTFCAWYDATGVANFPKGCNNNALGDANDAAIGHVSDGNGTHAGAALVGSANLFARTTHNGENCGFVEQAGFWEITPGLTSDGTNYYLLKTSVDIAAVTGGNTLATDLWGAAGIAALYDSIGQTYGALWAAGDNRTTYYGAAAQVFGEATSGTAWAATCAGIPLVGGVGGTNAFGNDGLLDYRPNEMCPISGGYWGNGSVAGVWALDLSSVRAHSSDNVGFRAALYL